MILVAILLVLLKLLSKKCDYAGEKYVEIKKKLYFGGFIRPQIQGYLVMAIATIISVPSIAFDSASNTFNSVISMLIFAFVPTAPFLTFAFLLANRQKLKD